MAKLKVYGGLLFIAGKQYRTVVAATSRKKAGELVGLTEYDMSQFWNTTGNAAELAIALPNPGVVFCTKDRHAFQGEYTEISEFKAQLLREMNE